MRRAIAIAAAAAAIFTAADAHAANDATLAARGEYLVRLGDCAACHTAVGGRPFAGGDAIDSPFGAIYAPNITPDKATGIGAWSDEDFYRAMHDGVGKNGQYLYPAFPYQWFSRVTREDVMAIKAYLDTVPAVDAPSRQTRLMFPFNLRIGLGAWNAAYFRAGPFKPDPAKSAEVNRGAYLVEGLGHCGDCHTPKGAAMEPIASKAFSGGAVDNWYAPNITSDVAHGIGGWSDADLAAYLKTGSAPGRGAAVGPMSQVTRDSLAYLTDEDLRAIVAFLKSTPPIADYPETPPSGAVSAHPSGEGVYLTHCAYCHQPNGKGLADAVPALDGNGVVRAKGPEDVVRVVLGGRLASGSYAPMPAVGADMSDDDIAAVVDYVRTAWTNAAPAGTPNGLVGAIRAQTRSVLSGSKGGEDACQPGADAPAMTPIVDPEGRIGQILRAMNGATMLQAIDQLIARAREVTPKAAQADIVNGLVLAYCRVGAADGGLADPDKRRLLNRFSQLVYTELASNGRD